MILNETWEERLTEIEKMYAKTENKIVFFFFPK